jgi:uncharacterized membrane protein YeaQ/YmgE (transglycosylase-associated protein family)
MAFLVWIVLGLSAGLLASKRFHHTASALALDVTLGVGGAVAGGFAFGFLGVTQSDALVAAGGVIGAAAGAVAMLACYRAIFRPA